MHSLPRSAMGGDHLAGSEPGGEGVLHQLLLLREMSRLVTHGGSCRYRTAGVSEHLLVHDVAAQDARRRYQAPWIMRFLLAPDDFLRGIRIPGDLGREVRRAGKDTAARDARTRYRRPCSRAGMPGGRSTPCRCTTMTRRTSLATRRATSPMTVWKCPCGELVERRHRFLVTQAGFSGSSRSGACGNHGPSAVAADGISAPASSERRPACCAPRTVAG